MYIEINKFGLSYNVGNPPVLILGVGHKEEIPHVEIKEKYNAKYQGSAGVDSGYSQLYYVYMYLTSKNYYVCPEYRLTDFVDII